MNRFIAALILTAAAVSATAGEQKRILFDIPAQSLSTALLKFSEQASIQVTASSHLVGDRHTDGVRGELGPVQALKQMLIGSGLSFEFINDGAVAIKIAGDIPATAQTPHPVPQGPEKNLTLALAQTDPPAASSADASATEEKKEDPASSTKKKEDVAEVVVTGTHIRGVGPVGSPVMVIDREDIERSGFCNG